MVIPTEIELARAFARRGLSRREILLAGTALGLSSSSIAAVLALSGREALASGQTSRAAARLRAQDSIFDPAEGADGPWPETVSPEPASQVTLAVAHAWDATFMQRQEQFDQLFTERHPNIVVKAENTSFADYLQKYTTQGAGGSLPDIMYCQFAWAQQLIQAELFQPLDDYVAAQPDFKIEDFTAPSLVSYQHDGKLYGIPYDEGPGMLYYNKDLFDAAGIGIPDETWTLDRLKEVALQLTSGEGPEKIYGLGELPSPGDGTIAPAYLYPFGAEYVNEPDETECRINQPEAVEAMQWWHELREQGAVPSPEDLQNVAWPAFQFGRIAMTVQGTWATPPIRANSKFNWDMALWPKGQERHSTYSAGSCYAITRDAQNADAAWIYLNEYLSTGGQSYMWGLTGRGSPARLSAWESFLTSKFASPGAKFAQQALTTIASHEILDKPTGPQVTQTAGPIWDEVIAGSLSVEEALNEVCAAIDPLLAENQS